MNSIKQIEPKDAYERMNNGAILIDVRDQDEFDQMSCDVNNVVCVPFDHIEEITKSVPLEKEIITMCLSGGRSYLASQKLMEMGYKNVSNMAGGIFCWKNENLPIK